MGRIGEQHDRVTLTLADEVVITSDSYEIQQSIITQPSTFSMRIGTGSVVRDLMAKYPPRTKFTLAIDGVTQFTGVTDGYTADASTGATQLNIRGRDTLAFLQGAHIRSDKTFTDVTYGELVEQVLRLAGPKEEWVLVYGNDANRKAVSGVEGSGKVSILDVADAVIGGDVFTDGDEDDAASENLKKTSTQSRAIRAKAGGRWNDLLRGELNRAPLMLWAMADGNIALSQPDTKQPACARIYRKRGATRNLVTVTSASFRNETAERPSECIVHMRRGGGAEARGKGYGRYVDQEMVDLGFDRPMVVADSKCKTLAQADAMARRKIAESRRAQWQLSYTVAGHTTPGLAGGRIIWTPDTVVEVDDDEFGLHGLFYVESVGKRRGPETTSTLTLMRLEDVIYGVDPQE